MAELMSRLKRAARLIATGRESQFYDDENIRFCLQHMMPTGDAASLPGRLNVVIPSVSRSRAYGGVSTLAELALGSFAQAPLRAGWSLRILTDEPAGEPDDNLVLHHARRFSVPPERITQVVVSEAPVPVAPQDVFLGSLWHSLPCVMPLLAFQRDTFGVVNSYVDLVQDYEPGFHPWSSAYLLAQAAYDAPWPRKTIFNSSELAAFYAAQGHPVAESLVFEPVMNGQLLDGLRAAPPGPKRRDILFYGRPTDRRNCFYLGRTALEIWSRRYEGARNWRVVSVGQSHDAFPLPGGQEVVVRGKLTLDGYVEALRQSAVGLSLMASPHPSYPPLEMAHFGVLTVTNAFAQKVPARWHDNILTAASGAPEDVADALVSACRTFDADTQTGLRGQSKLAHYLQPHAAQTFAAVSDMVCGALGTRA